MNYHRFTDDLFHAWNAHDRTALQDVYHRHAADNAANPLVSVAVGDTLDRFVHAFPDLRLRRTDTIADCGRVAVVFEMTGTHVGQLMGFNPSGKTIKLKGILIFECRDGKVSHASGLWDLASLIRQIGLLAKTPRPMAED
ncbi:ester cyclase [Siphonobacter aquaeclarae]|uniref:SnoaL-like polyketide cyclase n=1 Tax=Siphonobacter aquaeclarae TaxID=563176 RepID=A0A1G9V3R9_9BACT|nr:ester cyclase [Siphonobacter aquaeclarae]SDM66696.1 conserved hypothetical protein, steroid delta-isomerase-related [Siphonobacter aquaeclarae]